MSKNFLTAYKQIAPIKGSIEEQIAFLFEKSAEFIIQAQIHYTNNRPAKFCESLSKSNNILTGLYGLLGPDNKKSKINNLQTLEIDYSAPQTYFTAVFSILNRLTFENNSSHYVMLISSLKNMARTWRVKD